MLTLAHDGGTLVAVPAVHHKTVFAEMVNRLCADEATRPAAVAVELDPSAAAAAALWLTELGVAPGGKPLPCMLGLVRENRLIHPGARAAAALLQERSGRRLHELPAEVLMRELGYAPTSLLCLTPTDSIIEAIRCALELGIPCYGIDTEHAPAPREAAVRGVADPWRARGDLATYVRLLKRDLERARDPYGDGRREVVMAARLKTLLIRHKRVLWTGGLAHWPSLYALLREETPAPAASLPTGDPGVCRRVLVHPRQAVGYMDLFPRITAAYEAARQPASRCVCLRQDIDPQAAFRRCLEAALQRYVEWADADDPDPMPGLHGIRRYPGYLAQLCLFAQRLAPDLALALTAAQAMTSGAFARSLAAALMDFDWASPARFPSLPLMAPDAGSDAGRARPAGQGSGRVALRIPHSGGDGPEYEQLAPFFVTSMTGAPGSRVPQHLWSWPEDVRTTTRNPFAYPLEFIWPPCENLCYATIYQAVRIASDQRRCLRSEPCGGSLGEGIDLKATLRSALRGRPELFVKRRLKARPRRVAGEPVPVSYSTDLELQPVVVLFDPDPGAEDVIWTCLMAGTQGLYEDLSDKGKRLYRSLVGPGEHLFLESVSVGRSLPLPEGMEPWVRVIRLLHGVVRFGNPCVNWRQSAAWLEKGRFRAAPILDGSWSIETLQETYRLRHGLDIDLEDWPSALIMLGIPYARVTRRLVVVCPGTYRIEAGVRAEARRRRIELVTLPLAQFPAGRVEQIRRQYAVMAGPGGKTFPPEVERIFGQNQWAFSDLLPEQIRQQARPRRLPRPVAGAGEEVSHVLH